MKIQAPQVTDTNLEETKKETVVNDTTSLIKYPTQPTSIVLQAVPLDSDTALPFTDPTYPTTQVAQMLWLSHYPPTNPREVTPDVAQPSRKRPPIVSISIQVTYTTAGNPLTIAITPNSIKSRDIYQCSVLLANETKWINNEGSLSTSPVDLQGTTYARINNPPSGDIVITAKSGDITATEVITLKTSDKEPIKLEFVDLPTAAIPEGQEVPIRVSSNKEVSVNFSQNVTKTSKFEGILISTGTDMEVTASIGDVEVRTVIQGEPVTATLETDSMTATTTLRVNPPDYPSNLLRVKGLNKYDPQTRIGYLQGEAVSVELINGDGIRNSNKVIASLPEKAIYVDIKQEGALDYPKSGKIVVIVCPPSNVEPSLALPTRLVKPLGNLVLETKDIHTATYVQEYEVIAAGKESIYASYIDIDVDIDMQTVEIIDKIEVSVSGEHVITKEDTLTISSYPSIMHTPPTLEMSSNVSIINQLQQEGTQWIAKIRYTAGGDTSIKATWEDRLSDSVFMTVRDWATNIKVEGAPTTKVFEPQKASIDTDVPEVPTIDAPNKVTITNITDKGFTYTANDIGDYTIKVKFKEKTVNLDVNCWANQAMTVKDAQIDAESASRYREIYMDGKEIDLTDRDTKYTGIMYTYGSIAKWFIGIVELYHMDRCTGIKWDKSTPNADGTMSNITAPLPKTIVSLYESFANSTINVPGIANWDTGHIRNFRSCFYQNSVFNTDISGWTFDSTDWGAISNLQYFLNGARSFNQDLGSWVFSVPEPTGFSSGTTAWTLPHPTWAK